MNVYEKWEAEDRAIKLKTAQILAAWSLGWALRRLIAGALLALGGWLALRIVGAV
jgi:hypothetical protein